jgi:hypothetical protein
MTPGNYIACVLFLLGIGSGLLLAGISLLSTGTLEKRFQNEAASSYFFLRQVGASLGVSAAAVLIDQRMTVPRACWILANRLDRVEKNADIGHGDGARHLLFRKELAQKTIDRTRNTPPPRPAILRAISSGVSS